MSSAWEDIHGGGEDKPALAPDVLKTDADWHDIWKDRCRMRWALIDIEEFAKMKGDWATARMARRALLGKTAFDNEQGNQA